VLPLQDAVNYGSYAWLLQFFESQDKTPSLAEKAFYGTTDVAGRSCVDHDVSFAMG
jgi:hypothetical protein